VSRESLAASWFSAGDGGDLERLQVWGTPTMHTLPPERRGAAWVMFLFNSCIVKFCKVRAVHRSPECTGCQLAFIIISNI